MGGSTLNMACSTQQAIEFSRLSESIGYPNQQVVRFNRLSDAIDYLI
jgi:hypothetical protein